MDEGVALSVQYESDFDKFIERCAKRGPLKPTPLLLRYETGGYNNLHQDIYGPITFPLQMTLGLSSLGEDYQGGVSDLGTTTSFAVARK